MAEAARKTATNSQEKSRDLLEKHVVDSFAPFVQAIELYNCLKLRQVSI